MTGERIAVGVILLRISHYKGGVRKVIEDAMSTGLLLEHHVFPVLCANVDDLGAFLETANAPGSVHPSGTLTAAFDSVLKAGTWLKLLTRGVPATRGGRDEREAAGSYDGRARDHSRRVAFDDDVPMLVDERGRRHSLDRRSEPPAPRSRRSDTPSPERRPRSSGKAKYVPPPADDDSSDDGAPPPKKAVRLPSQFLHTWYI